MPHARVLIADDHPLVLAGLVRLLEDTFEVVGAVTDGNLLIEAAARLRPHVVVTDISMPGLNGIEALDRLKAAPRDEDHCVDVHVDAHLAAELIRRGASGYVEKIVAAAELVTAINQVLEGGVYLGLLRRRPSLACPTSAHVTDRAIDAHGAKRHGISHPRNTEAVVNRRQLSSVRRRAGVRGHLAAA